MKTEEKQPITSLYPKHFGAFTPLLASPKYSFFIILPRHPLPAILVTIVGYIALVFGRQRARGWWDPKVEFAYDVISLLIFFIITLIVWTKLGKFQPEDHSELETKLNEEADLCHVCKVKGAGGHSKIIGRCIGNDGIRMKEALIVLAVTMGILAMYNSLVLIK